MINPAGADEAKYMKEITLPKTVLTLYILDVLWGRPIKLIQVASNSELRENQWNDLLFF